MRDGLVRLGQGWMGVACAIAGIMALSYILGFLTSHSITAIQFASAMGTITGNWLFLGILPGGILYGLGRLLGGRPVWRSDWERYKARLGKNKAPKT